MEFCALPPSQIAEVPLSLFSLFDKWLEGAFNWLSVGPISEWVSDFKYENPKIYWCVIILLLPIIIICIWCLPQLMVAIATICMLLIMAITIVFTIVCKLMHILKLSINPPKHN